MGQLAVPTERTDRHGNPVYRRSEPGEFVSRPSGVRGGGGSSSSPSTVIVKQDPETGKIVPVKPKEVVKQIDQKQVLREQQEQRQQEIQSQKRLVEEQKRYTTGFVVEDKVVTKLPTGEVVGSITQRIRPTGEVLIETKKRGSIPTGSRTETIIDKSSFTPESKFTARPEEFKKTFAETGEIAFKEKKVLKEIGAVSLARVKELALFVKDDLILPRPTDFFKATVKAQNKGVDITPEILESSLASSFAILGTPKALAVGIYERPVKTATQITTDLALTYGILKLGGKAIDIIKVAKFENKIKTPAGDPFVTDQKGIPIIESETGAVLKGSQQQIIPKDFDIFTN